MALEKYLSTPVAILIAGAMIGAGLFFGLRGREAAPPPAPGADPVAANQPASAPASASPSAPAVALPPVTGAVPSRPLAVAAPGATADGTAAAREAFKALDAHRAAVVDRCVKPSLAKKPEPKTVKYSINLGFDASGKQIMRGVVEDHDTSRPDVTACMEGLVPPLQIPPPGGIVMIDVPWDLP